MVIEYAKQDGNVIGNSQQYADITHNPTRSAIGATTGVKMGIPLLRFYEKQSPRDGDKHIQDNHQARLNVEILCAELLDHLSSVGSLLRSRGNDRLLTDKRERFQQAHQI